MTAHATEGGERERTPDARSAMQSRWLDELDDAAGVIDAIRASLDDVERVADALVGRLAAGGCIFTCGNGGSSLAAQHFSAELVAHFRRDRAPLRSLALTPDAGLITAIANDFAFDQVFSRQVSALLGNDDALLVFSTSGRSPNVLAAAQIAHELGALTVAFTGRSGGGLAGQVDHALVVDDRDTARIQEGHLILTHLICERIDAAFTPVASGSASR